MQYLKTHKNLKYNIKSSLITFGATFLGVFATLVGLLEIPTTPEMITWAGLSSAMVTITRLFVISLAIAGQQFLSKYKK